MLFAMQLMFFDMQGPPRKARQHWVCAVASLYLYSFTHASSPQCPKPREPAWLGIQKALFQRTFCIANNISK